MKKMMLLAAILALALAAAAPAMAQDDPQVVADAKAKTATAGGPSGANAEANCDDGIIESKAGGVVAKAPCEAPPPPACRNERVRMESPKVGRRPSGKKEEAGPSGPRLLCAGPREPGRLLCAYPAT